MSHSHDLTSRTYRQSLHLPTWTAAGANLTTLTMAAPLVTPPYSRVQTRAFELRGLFADRRRQFRDCAGSRRPPPLSAPPSLASSDGPDARKIANALSAGPKYVTEHATVMDWPSPQDKEQKMRVLREGSNGWSCMPDPPGLPRHSPICADQTTMKWMMAIMAGKKTDIDRVGVSYMLQGEAGSDVQSMTAKTNSISPLFVIPVAKSDEKIIIRKAEVYDSLSYHLHRLLRSERGWYFSAAALARYYLAPACPATRHADEPKVAEKGTSTAACIC
jgi:hypothetical protein